MVSGLAKVTSGWTGTLAIGNGSVVAFGRESAISLILRGVASAARANPPAEDWSVSVDSSGVLTVAYTGGGTFGIACSGTAEGRLNMTSSLSGAASYTFDGPHTGAVYFTRGLMLSSAGGRIARGVAITGDGSGGGIPTPAGTSATLTIHDTYANIWGYESTLSGVYDCWVDGVRLPRIRIAGTSRAKLGRGQDQVQLDAACMTVSQ